MELGKCLPPFCCSTGGVRVVYVVLRRVPYERMQGSAVGTGHDCAKICRRQLSSAGDREDYLGVLLGGAGSSEEAKLVLALTIQRSRYRTNGTYREVMNGLASLRYKGGDGDDLLAADLVARYGSVMGC